ncbi:MAG: helix-turn-helix domain-containing protein [Erysipelotrichaceae bacterium]|nr:helix-turn-helix domain-containing protein [Erysipelotrichaceae bacterium]
MNAEKQAGEKLRKLLKENDLTQEEFAELFGIDVRTCNRLINEGITNVATLEELAIFFNIQIKDFFE